MKPTLLLLRGVRILPRLRSTTCVINVAWNFWFHLSKEAAHLKDARSTDVERNHSGSVLLMF